MRASEKVFVYTNPLLALNDLSLAEPSFCTWNVKIPRRLLWQSNKGFSSRLEGKVGVSVNGKRTGMVQRFVLIHVRSIKELTRAADFTCLPFPKEMERGALPPQHFFGV